MKIRDRIKSFRRVKASELLPNPRNWRRHPPEQQDAMRALLAEVGFAGAVLARETKDGLQLIDGHLRAELSPDAKVPVLVLDVTEKEAAKLLATFDPVGKLAEADPKALGKLLAEIDTESEALAAMLDELAAEHRIDPFEAGGEEGTNREPPSILKAATLSELAPSEEERAILAGRSVLLEFSGGKDSSAAAVWIRHFLPEAEVELLFVDLGADFVGFGLFLHQFAEWIGCPLRILRSKTTMIDRFLAKGKWPHFKFPYCQEQLHDSLDVELAKFDDSKVVMVRGGRRQEKAGHKVQRRSRKQERVTDCNCSSCPAAEEVAPDSRWMKVKRLPGYRFFQPLYLSDKASSEAVLKEAGAPVWEGYGRGLCRTACRVCPGQRPRAYAAIRREFPEVWRELLALETILGPGAWQAREGKNIPLFTALADKGEAQLASEAAKKV